MRKLCSITTCGRTRSSSGGAGNTYCESHYRRARKFGDPLAGPPIIDRRPDRREYVIGEVEWFFECGVSPELTMTALGYRERDSIAKSLTRWGRPDLAARFQPGQEESWFNQWLEGKHRVA